MTKSHFIFDAVMHLFDLRQLNAQSSVEQRRRDYKAITRVTGNIRDFTELSDTPNEDLEPTLKGDFDAIYDTMFDRGHISMAMVGNGSALQNAADDTLDLCHKFALAHPERAILGGGIDPMRLGVEGALKEIEFQARELGARSMKFYPFTWNCDDRDIAYPLYRKCLDEGIGLVQFHKLLPLSTNNVETMRPNDIQAPARDFPELAFLLHHVGDLYYDETVSIAQRFPNVYLVLTPAIHMLVSKPRWAQKKLGHLLQNVGPEKMIYGSEGPMMGDPNVYIDAFLNMELPQDLREGYGYPAFTDEDHAMILGGNFARLLGIDIPEKSAELDALPKGR